MMTVTKKLNKTKLGADWKAYKKCRLSHSTSPCQLSFRTIHQATLTCIRVQFHSLVARRPCSLLNCAEWNIDTKWTDIMFLDFCQERISSRISMFSTWIMLIAITETLWNLRYLCDFVVEIRRWPGWRHLHFASMQPSCWSDHHPCLVCQYAAILLIGSPSVPRLVNLFKSMLLVWRVQSRPRPCAIGATFVTLSHPNCLNMPKGLVNIALGTHRYSQRALAKPNLILKYTNIFLIVQKCVVLHYIANANCGICCIWRPVIISKLVILCGYVRCPPLAWACPLSALTMDWRACEQREIHAKLDGKMWLFILEMSY